MNKENEVHKLTIEDAQQKFGEKQNRIELQKAFDNLKHAEENVEKKIKKEIKLN